MQVNKKIAVETALAPAPVGPYNQAIACGGWLFCSGQIALDPSSGAMIEGGCIEQETRQVIKNLLAVLDAGGATKDQVVKTNIFLADMNDFKKVNEIYSETFGEGISPARACVEASALPKNARIEIECIAIIG